MAQKFFLSVLYVAIPNEGFLPRNHQTLTSCDILGILPKWKGKNKYYDILWYCDTAILLMLPSGPLRVNFAAESLRKLQIFEWELANKRSLWRNLIGIVSMLLQSFFNWVKLGRMKEAGRHYLFLKCFGVDVENAWFINFSEKSFANYSLVLVLN